MNKFRRDYEVDILIRGWGNKDLTRNLLNSIVQQTDMQRVMVTYVDNGSPRDDLLNLMTQYRGDSFQFVSLPFNHGSVRAINVGLTLAALSPAKFVLLMDNDTTIPSGDMDWLDRWLSYFADEQVGAAGAVSGYTSGFQHAEANPDLFQKEWSEGDESGLAEPPPVPILVSFAMMLRKQAVLKVGLFDEQFEPGNCEDYDYVLRLREAGFKAVIAASVWVHHKGSQTFGKMDFDALLAQNFGKLEAKYGKKHLEQMGLQLA
jgi:O-antigen biosynthesis protein